jgi:hypothetical protein
MNHLKFTPVLRKTDGLLRSIYLQAHSEKQPVDNTALCESLCQHVTVESGPLQKILKRKPIDQDHPRNARWKIKSV